MIKALFSAYDTYVYHARGVRLDVDPSERAEMAQRLQQRMREMFPAA